MKILITGSTGMVGRNISQYKLFESMELLLPTRLQLDLSNFTATLKFIKSSKPDFIIHAAGKVGGIIANMTEPTNFLVENVDIGRNLIIAAKHCDIKKLINISSSCLYPRFSKNPINENQILKGELEPTNEGYALAKILALKLCEYIHQEDSSFQYKTIIPCNLYGPYDKFDENSSHLIPAVLNRIHNAKVNNSESIKIWGDGTARREFMHVRDLADFVAFAVTNFTKLPQVSNVGLGKDYSIKEYYTAISNIVGYNGSFEYDLSKPIGMKQKLVDNSKINDMGWKHKITLIDGLKDTYNYYLDHVIK